MNLSLENEIKLKKILKSSDKKLELTKLSSEIELKESAMLKYISRDYMNIINKCNSLEEIKRKIPLILEKNDTLSKSFKDSLLYYHEITSEIQIHKELDQRIKDVLEELGHLESFFKYVTEDIENNSLYLFKLTNNLLQCRRLLSKFLNYSFFDDLNQIFVSFKNKILEENNKCYEKWINYLKKSSKSLGVEILESVRNIPLDVVKDKSLSDSIKCLKIEEDKNVRAYNLIFNEVFSMKSRIITTDILTVLWVCSKLEMFETIVDRINFDRRKMIESHLKQVGSSNNSLYIYACEILTSYFLNKTDKGINFFYETILETINNYFINGNHIMNTDSVNSLNEAKDILVPFKRLLGLLNIEDDILNQAIGKMSMDYFEYHTICKLDISEITKEDYKDTIIKFINDSNNFISEISNHEIVEILSKKVDNNLEEFMEYHDDITEVEDVVEEILRYMKSKNLKYLSQRFRSEEILERRVKEYKKDIFEECRERIDTIFRKESKDFSVKINNVFIRNKRILDELYFYTKKKFMDLLGDVKNKSKEEKRLVASRISCFSKFLNENNAELYEDFNMIDEEANNI